MSVDQITAEPDTEQPADAIPTTDPEQQADDGDQDQADPDGEPAIGAQIRQLFHGSSAVFTALARGSRVLTIRIRRWAAEDKIPRAVVLLGAGGLIYLFPKPLGYVALGTWVIAAFFQPKTLPPRKPAGGERPATKPGAEPATEPGAHAPCDNVRCDECFEDIPRAAAPEPLPAEPAVSLVKPDASPAEMTDDELILKVTEWVVAEAPAKGERGAHVAQILRELQTEHDRFPTWKTAELAARLRELGVPVERQLKVAGSPLPGVRYDALQQWLGRMPALPPHRVPNHTATD